MSDLLHQENLNLIPVTGEFIRGELEKRVGEVAVAASARPDTNVSVVIRSQDNRGQLESLLEDLDNQHFDGETEIILVDTESSDGSVAVARSHGATVISISQEDFTYPAALNLGFEAASYPWVFSFVDHSLLTNKNTLRVATQAETEDNVAGVYGLPFPNQRASITDRVGAAVMYPNRVRKEAAPSKLCLGFLASNTCVINRAAWEDAGRFDLNFAAGGEDGALGKKLLQAGHNVHFNPAMSVYHSHDVGLIGSLKQARYWASLTKPQAFDRGRLQKFRRDLGPS